MIKQLIWKLTWIIKNLYYRFGNKTSKEGFVMPTVFGFIIISSSVILYHSLALVTQIYSVKSAADDLKTIEKAVNTNRVISEIDNSSNCHELPQLSYKPKNERQFQMSVNCLLMNTNNTPYNNDVQAVLQADRISKDMLEDNVNAILKAQIDLIDVKNAQVYYENQTVDIAYNGLMYIAVVEVSEDDIRVLLIDDKQNLIKNTSVN